MIEIIKELDKILKTYLTRTIAVNQFGLREKLLELLENKLAKQKQEILRKLPKEEKIENADYYLGYNQALKEIKNIINENT